MYRSFKLACLAGVSAFGFLSATAQASVVVFNTADLTGSASVTGFADGSPGSFTATFQDLAGTASATALPNGNYNVSAQGSVSFTGFPGPGGSASLSLIDPLRIFSGALSSSGLTAGTYTNTFIPGVAGVNDGPGFDFGFIINYDGQTSTQVLSALSALLGFAFVDPNGAGTLTVSGKLYADGAVVDFTESNLTWVGFGNLLAAADFMYGGGDGKIDGTFAMRNVTVTADIPEPAPIALVGLALAGLALTRRRQV